MIVLMNKVQVSGMNDKQVTATPREIRDTASGVGEHGPESWGKARVGHREFDDPPRLANSATAGNAAIGYFAAFDMKRVRVEIRRWMSPKLESKPPRPETT